MIVHVIFYTSTVERTFLRNAWTRSIPRIAKVSLWVKILQWHELNRKYSISNINLVCTLYMLTEREITTHPSCTEWRFSSSDVNGHMPRICISKNHQHTTDYNPFWHNSSSRKYGSIDILTVPVFSTVSFCIYKAQHNVFDLFQTGHMSATALERNYVRME